VWAAFGPRPQPVGSAQPAATHPGQPTARRSAARAWPGRRGRQELTGGPRAARLARRASSVVPGKEMGVVAHPSGRSMSRR
jgi:hypothetical protein